MLLTQAKVLQVMMIIKEHSINVKLAEKKPAFHKVAGGYVVVIDQMGIGFVLESARGSKRLFKSIGFMEKFCKSVGFDSFEVVGFRG